jgi:small subunit ribosomal protein S24e
MELEIIQDNTNVLLDRRELTIKINTPTTPSRGILREQIAAKYDANIEAVVIEKIITEFGKQEIVAEARIYTDSTKAAETENTYVLERDKKSMEALQASRAPPESKESPTEEEASEDEKATEE